MAADLSARLCRTKDTGYTKYTGIFRSFIRTEISRRHGRDLLLYIYRKIVGRMAASADQAG